MVRLLALVRYHRDVSVSLLLTLFSVVLIALPSSLKLGYVKKLNRFILSPAQQVTVYLSTLNDMEQEIASLRADNARLSLELSRSSNLVFENRRLRNLLGFTREKGVLFLPARVLSTSLDEPMTTILLDKGADDGVTVYAPVLSTEGLVGKILEVDGGTSLAELFTHPQFRAGALVPGRGEAGILKSEGRTLLLTGLSMNSEIAVGDRVVTSGLGGVYPQGVPIGKISAVADDEIGIEKIAKVRPFVALSRLFEVAVLVDENFVSSDTTVLRRAKGSLMWLWEADVDDGER